MNRPPSSYKVLLAANELAALRESLIAIDPTIEEDQRLFADMLEGEGGDALEVIERLIEASIDAELMADLAQAHIDVVKAGLADVATRKARFDRRRETYRAGALQVLERINLRKLERATFTANLREMPEPLIIDADALSDDWCEIKRAPRKRDIRNELEAGRTVVGARLGNAPIGLAVHRK